MRATSRLTNEARRSGVTLVLCLTLVLPAWASDEAISCHIHPPGSTPSNPVGLIGPFDTPALCEQARFERLGDAGRCHCVADFSPRWIPPTGPASPADRPFG